MSKKLTKSSKNALVSGVCAGLASHFGVNPNLLRVLWVLFGGTGVGILVYFLLAFYLPDQD